MNNKLPPDLVESIGDRRQPKPSRKSATCAVCGQEYNLSDLAEAVHHSAEPHEPVRAA